MEVKQYKTFKFDELSEEAKEKALENLYDINIDHNWWDFIYCDAEEVGVKIEEFDLHHRTIKVELCEYMDEVIESILKHFGEKCEITRKQ